MPTGEIRPNPSAEEAAAIAAAVELLWPKPMTVGPHRPRTTTTWRFSGRWWQRDRFAPPERPWT